MYAKGQISGFLSLKETHSSVIQNKTVEYFTFVAALFLPLTVFVVTTRKIALINLLQSLFGMNVGGMTADNPSWGVFAKATVPGTSVSCLLVLSGYYLWTRTKEAQMVLPWLEAQAYGLKDPIVAGYKQVGGWGVQGYTNTVGRLWKKGKEEKEPV